MPTSVIEVIVVDDGSTDRTAAVAAEAGFRVVRHPNNRGYGAALKTGVREATGDYILTMDADGQHRMEDVATLCDAVSVPDPSSASSDIVNSSSIRLSGGFPERGFSLCWRRYSSGARSQTSTAGCASLGVTLPCATCTSAQRVFVLDHHHDGSDESRLRGLVRADWVEKRVGHSTVSASTGFETILLVIRLATLFNPLRIFLPASAICILGGMAWGIPYLIARQGLTVASMLAILTGILLFALGLVCDQVSQLRLERFE